MNYFLVGDIGGTNKRLAILDFNLNIISKINIDSSSNIIDSINNFLRLESLENRTTSICCICIAGPIEKHSLEHLTNSNFLIDKKEILNKTAINNLFIINDFEAIGHAILELNLNNLTLIKKNSHIMTDTNTTDNTPDNNVINNENMLVVGPGTGLGVCQLVKFNKDYKVLPSQASYSLFSIKKEYFKLQQFIQEKYGLNFLYSERLISGKALDDFFEFLIHNFSYAKELIKLNKINTSNEISNDFLINALNNNESISSLLSKYHSKNDVANLVFILFKEFLAYFLQSMALITLPYSGIILAGGILPKNKWLFENNDFNKYFVDIFNDDFKEILEKIPIYLIEDYDISFYGCGAFLKKSLP